MGPGRGRGVERPALLALRGSAVRDAPRAGVVEPHFGSPTGGTQMVVFVNSSAVPYIKPLTDFVPSPYWNVQPGDNTAVPANIVSPCRSTT